MLSNLPGLFPTPIPEVEHSAPDLPILFPEIRKYLAGSGSAPFDTHVAMPYDAEPGGQLFVTVYEAGKAPIRRGARLTNFKAALQRILDGLRQNPALASFSIEDESRSRLLLEYVTSSKKAPGFSTLVDDRLGPHRFEPGITGLRFKYGDQLYFYMPSDAFTRSHLTLTQLAQYLAKRIGKKTKGKTTAVEFANSNFSDIRLLRSRAFVTFRARILELYRGYPHPLIFTRETVQDAFLHSVDWLIRHQSPNGKFLYFYDASTDSTDDFQHPRQPHYYNMLRHCGGIITLLRAHELSPAPRYLSAALLAIDYLFQGCRTYERGGRRARYVLDNKKAKLGGSGLGLVALMHYYRLTRDGHFLPECQELVTHILSQIDEEGEFLGYYIHPLFNDGKPLDSIGDTDKRKLFSFYYPGEALLGLALYERFAPIAEESKNKILEAGTRALNFLVHQRPKKYPELFLPLPSDGWLMQAIEEWWHNPLMRSPDFSKFVSDDADRMIEHMYQEHNSPYSDYPGTFYYYYGQHALPDGSRGEGLIAAYYLALKEGRQAQAERLLHYCRLLGKTLMQTYNSAESMYAARCPEKAVGAFRFKFTRQWVRVDSIQHTACFYARLLPHI